jgi:hypothetical protein
MTARHALEMIEHVSTLVAPHHTTDLPGPYVSGPDVPSGELAELRGGRRVGDRWRRALADLDNLHTGRGGRAAICQQAL